MKTKIALAAALFIGLASPALAQNAGGGPSGNATGGMESNHNSNGSNAGNPTVGNGPSSSGHPESTGTSTNNPDSPNSGNH